MAAAPRICAVLAADANYFYQTRAAIESIRRAEGGALDIRLITIGPYPREQLEWLKRAQVTTFGKIDDLPRFPGAPLYAVALTCRPYLPQIFPDVDGFVWVDSDIRFALPSGLAAWTAQAADPTCPVAAVQESEPAYSINAHPFSSRTYHELTTARLRTVYGDKVADYMQYFKLFNAGLFAMHARSAVWARYRANLERSLAHPFDKLREQDALNVAIIEEGVVRPMPSILNWLCSAALPVKGPSGLFLTPNLPQRAIEVLHLSNSDESGPSIHEGQTRTFYDVYREMGLTS
jgi:lipopolysaccharide biosynthesis glycosyltransferase